MAQTNNASSGGIVHTTRRTPSTRAAAAATVQPLARPAARRVLALFFTVALTAALLACSESATQGAAPATAAANPPAPTAAATPSAAEARLKQENEQLRAEVAKLKAQVADLSQTPQALLQAVQSAVAAGQLAPAQGAAAKLEQRYGPSAQLKTAQAEVAKLERAIAEREAQAKRLEAMGFYALKPNPSVTTGNMVVKLESLTVGNRWIFDDHGDSYHYRDVQRGEKFVLMRTTLRSTDNTGDPDLPDVAVYRIDGKTMVRVQPMNYEFRRWSSYGTFIGLHHDFKNDFAHTAAIPFNAAASIPEDVVKQPLAVVVTGNFCHSRGKRIGQPQVDYTYQYDCGAKTILTAEDFNGGSYQVLAFLNKPKGL